MIEFEKWFKKHKPYEAYSCSGMAEKAWRAALEEVLKQNKRINRGSIGIIDWVDKELELPENEGTPAEDRYGRDVESEKVKPTCEDCRLFNPKLISSCETVGYGTKADNNSCDRFESKLKPLAQYLDEYIEVELDFDNIGPGVGELFAYDSWRELLEQALDAYESAEGVKVRIDRVP